MAEADLKYGVPELSKALGILPASVRVQLRKHGIPVAGKSYGWATRKEFDEILAKIKSEPAAPAPKAEKTTTKTAKAKPGKKAPVKAVVKKKQKPAPDQAAA